MRGFSRKTVVETQVDILLGFGHMFSAYYPSMEKSKEYFRDTVKDSQWLLQKQVWNNFHLRRSSGFEVIRPMVCCSYNHSFIILSLLSVRDRVSYFVVILGFAFV